MHYVGMWVGGDGEGGRHSNLNREREEKNPWSSREGECERNEASMRKPGGRLGDPGNPKQMQETEMVRPLPQPAYLAPEAASLAGKGLEVSGCPR